MEQFLHYANWNEAGVICLSAYVLGCFAAGYYLVRMRLGEDIRELGSGSVGARNVGRVLGKTGFIVTLVFDFGKGCLAVWAARQFTTDEHLVALAMAAVVAGHIWPAQLRFHGGKGMATSLGALVIYDGKLALIFALLFVCFFLFLHRTTLPSLFALACLPIVDMLLTHDHGRTVLIATMAGLVIVAHRRNLMEEFSHFVEPPDVHPKIDQT